MVALGLVLLLAACVVAAQENPMGAYSVRVRITSPLELPNVPLECDIDFARLIEEADGQGVLDPNSVEVIDAETDEAIPHARSEDFNYGDRGRIRWVIPEPAHVTYEVRFRTVAERPQLKPQAYTPPIGVGDLLHYNAGEPRPVALIYPSGLVDLDGDGRPDLVGCWNYAHDPHWPWDGIVCFPRVGGSGRLELGDMVRLSYRDEAGATRLFTHIYMCADFADLDGDGLVDLVYSPRGRGEVTVFLNTGDRQPTGLPIFEPGPSFPVPKDAWSPCRAVDLNGDGAVDLVVGGWYLRNSNPEGWPMEPAEPVKLDAGLDACFYDVDGDGLLDAVCLVDGPEQEPRDRGVAWRKNLGGDPPEFAPEELLEDIDDPWCNAVAAVREGSKAGLLVGHDVWQQVSFYEQVRPGRPRFRKAARAESVSAVMSLSDQAWPCFCDWDGDGDLDMLVGGGYGWPRIVINDGTLERPRWAEAKLIEAEGGPIRLLRDDILGGEHWHNMGYPYPWFVDWDGDGLPDLMLPNETNRIFWYRNIGTRRKPKFGKRRQVIVDGYPDSPEARDESARLAADEGVPNNPYPYEEAQPFFWRTGAGFADLNGDGLMDLITHDGQTRKLTLFVQYRGDDGELHLRKEAPLKLADGRLIDDAIVGRAAHWTESFRCVDWDGDGLVDIIYACAGSERAKGSIHLLRNVGTASEPLFAAPETLCCYGTPIYVTAHGPQPWLGDLTGDGRPDLVTCVEWSVYPFYRHAAMAMSEAPKYSVGRARRRGG